MYVCFSHKNWHVQSDTSSTSHCVSSSASATRQPARRKAQQILDTIQYNARYDTQRNEVRAVVCTMGAAGVVGASKVLKILFGTVSTNCRCTHAHTCSSACRAERCMTTSKVKEKQAECAEMRGPHRLNSLKTQEAWDTLRNFAGGDKQQSRRERERKRTQKSCLWRWKNASWQRPRKIMKSYGWRSGQFFFLYIPSFFSVCLKTSKDEGLALALSHSLSLSCIWVFTCLP